MTVTGDLLNSALSALAFIPCAMAAVAPAPNPQTRRREVVVNGKRVKTIDVHAHCIVPAAAAIINHPLESPGLLMHDTSTRIAAMDAQGIDVEVLSINPYWYRASRDAAKAELLHRIFDLLGGQIGVLQRGGGERLEAVGAGDRLHSRRHHGVRTVGRRCDLNAGGTGVTDTLTHGWYTIFHGSDRCNSCRCDRRAALPHRAFAPSGPPQRSRQSASSSGEKPPAGELLHTACARKTLRHRCDAEEEPMSDLAARFVYSPLLSTAFKVVCLFCVLGLALSVAIVPMIAPEYLAWVLSHIE